MEQIEKLIKVALKSIKNNKYGDLLPGYRQVIYNSLGPFVFDRNSQNNYGYLRRATLALCCTKKVASIPSWNTCTNDLKHVPRYLQNALLMLNDNKPVVLPKISNLWNNLENISDRVSDSTCYAVIASLQALEVCKNDECFSPDDSINFIEENSTDPLNWDTAFATCEAITSYYIENKSEILDNQADTRRRFWEWWLTEGIDSVLLINKTKN